jgi:hypothetical protein
MNNFPWGYFPQSEDTVNQAVEFTIKNPAGYAGERAISVQVKKAVPVGSGADYPYRTGSSSAKIFEGEPMVSALSITETLPAGQPATFGQTRSLTLKFSLNLVAGSTYSKVGTATTFTISGLVTNSADNAALSVGGASAALFGGVGKLDKCLRTLVLTTTSDILPANKDITLTFDLTSVGYMLASTTVSLSSSVWLSTNMDTNIDPSISVPGAVLQTIGVAPTATYGNKALTRVAAGFPAVEISGVVASETVALTSSLECSAAFGGASATQTAAVIATGSKAALATSGLGAGSYTACIRPNDGCGDAGVGNPTAGVLTVVQPTWSAVPAAKVGDPTVITITGGVALGDGVIVITSSQACSAAYAYSTDASNINQKRVTAVITVPANGIVSIAETLADGQYKVCYITAEMYNAGQTNTYYDTDASKTFTMNTNVVIPSGPIVVSAAVAVYPTVLVTIMSAIAAILMLQQQ